mgnify:CR=1 FL=1
MPSWNKQDFCHFLTTELEISPRVAKDYADRCGRIQKILNVDLADYTKNATSYMDLLLLVHQHFTNLNKEKKTLYALNGTNMKAITKLALILWGEPVVSSYKKYFYRSY